MNKLPLVLVLGILFGCGRQEGTLFSNPKAAETGIGFVNQLTETEHLNILDYMYFYNGGGVAIGDINNDGLPDIFFSGNQVQNKLYLNQGGLKFEDISAKAGIGGNSSWNTGAVMGDVNGDGYLDIYVCAVVGINGFNGHNELYINNGDDTFTERSAEYGLDLDTYSASAAFLDYDSDGDLDIYLLNQAVHTKESFGRADLRKVRNYESGDRLLRNDTGTFTDVSETAGIYGGANGYGLGVTVADFNQDGRPDIYVGNDFHEDDYYYLNNGNGTFTECLRDHLGQSSRSSMGNDAADINHDGWPDLITLDMLPDEEKVLKSTENDEDYHIQKLQTEYFGYYYQSARNMLQVNNPEGHFEEVALLSGVAATDWSWSALFADFNQDGEKDLFVSNGILKRPNDLDYLNFVSDEQVRKKLSNTRLVDEKALEMMPEGRVHNYLFEGTEGITFTDRSGDWIAKDTMMSGATAFGDLDNDGDLDLVTNNLNSGPGLYINKTNEQAAYLKIKFRYPPPNTQGIGTKVLSYNSGKLQYQELYTVRGFQASSEPIVHFGYGQAKSIDSLRIVWPDGRTQLIKDVPVNQTLVLQPENTGPFDYNTLRREPAPLFKKTRGNLGIDFTHLEDDYVDFNRQKLIPYKISDRGPATATGDIDNDGKQDLFFGGSKFIPSRIFLQRDTAYIEKKYPEIAADSVKEDVAAVIADFNRDGRSDLYLGSGGADFYNKMKPLLDSYYTGGDSVFNPAPVPEEYENASVILPEDFDHDGDLDLFVASNAVSADFGNIPNSYLLRNDGGTFQAVENQELQQAGMITDGLWDDVDGDGTRDLVVVGEWMGPKFFMNKNGVLHEESLTDRPLTGLWESIVAFDIDSDGDTDYILGNWGLNTKFRAQKGQPMRMYYGDFDGNGSTETILAVAKDGKYYPLEGFADLSGQLAYLKEKFKSYKDFAGLPIEKVLGNDKLEKARVFEVSELRTGYLENQDGHFKFVPLDNSMQLAPVTSLLKYDFDGDGKEEVLAAGNYFGVKPFHGRLGSFPGAIIRNAKEVVPGNRIGLDLTQRSARSLDIIPLNGHSYLLVTFNNARAQVYELVKKYKGK